MALSVNYVLRMMLAVSAMHISRLRESGSTRYVQLAEIHAASALRDVTAALGCIRRENCPALYITTTLVCIYELAKGPRPGYLMISAHGGEVPWLRLLRGVKFIISTMGYNAIFNGVLGPIPSKMAASLGPLYFSASETLPVEWADALRRISVLVDLSNHDQNTYQGALSVLSGAVEVSFGNGKVPDHIPVKSEQFRAAMAWLYKVTDDFVSLVEKREAIALIILAYYAVLLAPLEWIWYMEGWAKHIIDTVDQLVDYKYAKCLEWPREKINCILDSSRQ
jgi:hypothetical protein